MPVCFISICIQDQFKEFRKTKPISHKRSIISYTHKLQNNRHRDRAGKKHKIPETYMISQSDNMLLWNYILIIFSLFYPIAGS